MDTMKTVSILGVLIVLVSCGSDGDEASKNIEDRIEKAMKNKIEDEERVLKIARSYNAIVGWEDSLKSYGKTLYTVELQNEIKKASDRPILHSTYLYDIIERENDYLLLFNDRGPFSFLRAFDKVDIQYELTANPELVDSLLNSPLIGPGFDKFAIIANIRKIHKIKFSATSVDNDNSVYDVYISLVPVYLAKGELLDYYFFSREY